MLLWHTIREIADAIKKFFKDTEDDYDDKLGFELKKDKLQQEVNDLNQKKLELLALVHTAFPKLAVAIAKLISAYGNNNKNIAEEFGLLVDLVLKAGGVGSFIQKLTSYQVAVAGADGYQSPVFSSKNSNNNGVNIDKTPNTGIPLIQEPKADHCDNNSNNASTIGENNQNQKVRDVPTDIYLQKNTQLVLSKGGVSIESRHFTSTLFSVYCILSLSLRLLVKNNTIVKGRKEQQLIPKAIKSAEEQDIELREQQLTQSLQPYELKVPDFKVFHNSD